VLTSVWGLPTFEIVNAFYARYDQLSCGCVGVQLPTDDKVHPASDGQGWW
jgi:hypothetical protein